MTGPPSVAVIGAGFGGIAAAVELRRAGIPFTVFERSAGPGGTWWDNRYPGAETDAPSHLYSYSFAPYDWTRTHVRQPELQRYLEDVIDRFGLRPHLRFGAGVASLRWSERAAGYLLTTDAGAEHTFPAVISAVGLFGRPRWPSWPGLADFAGPVLHTAQWRDAPDLDGLHVAVVGTGSSAAQVVPALAGRARHLTLFQRQPGWLLPKNDRDFSPRERRLYRSALAQRAHRVKLYAVQECREFRGALFRPGTRTNTRARAAALAYIDEVFADRPDLRAAVTPDYAFAGKRAVLSSDFYPALLRPDVTVVPRAVRACTPTGLVDVTGQEHPVDAIVLATGFEATNYLSSLEIAGRDGLPLAETWAGEPTAFAGMMVPGFPNLFLLYGPNTNGGLIVSNLQRQARFAVREVSRLRRRGLPTVEVSAAATERYNRWLQSRMRGLAFVDGNNYYKAASGRVVTQWPDNATSYAVVLRVLRASALWRVRSSGVRPGATPVVLRDDGPVRAGRPGR